MQPTLCSRCKENVAVIFITRIENGESHNEGLCLRCARELHIKPVDEMMEKLGISDADLDNLTGDVAEMLGSMGMLGGDDAADEGLADRDGHDTARALDQTALADADVRAEHDDADAALLEVQRHAERAVLEAEQLVGFAFIQPVHLGDAVADLNDVADLILLRLGCIIFDLILDDLTDIVDSEIHGFTNLIF